MSIRKKSRPFFQTAIIDGEWLLQQTEAVKILWLESSVADPFGDGKEFMTSLKPTAFRTARKKIEDYGAFEYSRVANRRDERVTDCWHVTNLRAREYRNKWQAGNQSKYQEFLNSDYWQNVREQVLERDNHTCQGCGVTTNLHVHHMTYNNHGSEHEHLDDLITLCEVCHRKVHGLED